MYKISDEFEFRPDRNTEYGVSCPWPPSIFNTDRSIAVLMLWFLTVTCSCCPYLYFGSAIMLVTYFSKF